MACAYVTCEFHSTIRKKKKKKKSSSPTATGVDSHLREGLTLPPHLPFPPPENLEDRNTMKLIQINNLCLVRKEAEIIII